MLMYFEYFCIDIKTKYVGFHITFLRTLTYK